MTAEANDAIELAVQEARAFGHHYLGTEHLLLGVLREDAGLGGQVVRASGVTLDQARDVAKQLLAEDATSSSASETREPS